MLTPQRRRELALLTLQHAVSKDPMDFAFAQRRKFCEIAAKLHILPVHLERLMRPMYQRAMGQTFTTPQEPHEEIPTDEVSGSLAYAVLKEVISRHRLKLNVHTTREIEAVALELNLPSPEFLEFAREMYQEILNEMFA